MLDSNYLHTQPFTVFDVDSSIDINFSDICICVFPSIHQQPGVHISPEMRNHLILLGNYFFRLFTHAQHSQH